jgi:hypothetical protein
MGEIIGQIPALAGLVEKGGVIGLLVIVCAVLGYEVRRLRAELAKTYGQRDKYRVGFVICKAECDRAGLKPDLSSLADIVNDAHPA